jgi:hypothetical protein
MNTLGKSHVRSEAPYGRTAAASAKGIKLQIAGGEIAIIVTTTDMDRLATFGLSC